MYGRISGSSNEPAEIIANEQTPIIVDSRDEFTPANIKNIFDTGYLALINHDYSVSPETNRDLLKPAWPTVPVSFVDGTELHPTALDAVAELFDAARAADVGSFFVSSGFRCYDSQTLLYDNGANAAAMPPGHSEHHTGLAADIFSVGISEMGNSAEGRWLAENSYRYGLILRYPQGAAHITGIEFEPWHFRYVGKPHAYFMRKNNLVLEEYIELIQRNENFNFEMNGTTYFISYQIPQNEIINLPVGMQYSISSDNTGGFIVTMWVC
jgi:D-alanyl-D-alanine carboxypeptidase